jgi:hypothetical protein
VAAVSVMMEVSIGLANLPVEQSDFWLFHPQFNKLR